MAEIKDAYVIEWMGPYKSIDEMYDYEDTEFCSLYIITGRMKHQKSYGIKYIGITKRDPCNRLQDPDHIEKQKNIKDKEYWTGRFSVSSYNILTKGVRRNRAELVEHLLVKYLNLKIGYKHFLNDKKTKAYPKKPVVIISRGLSPACDKDRYNKPSILKDLPDVLMYVDGEFFTSNKLKKDF